MRRVLARLRQTLFAGGPLALLGGTAAAIAAFASAFVYSGLYDISAKSEHTAVVYWLVHAAMLRAVEVRAAAIQVPALSDPAMLRCGQAIFTQHCVQCHGGPGVAPHDFAIGLRPEATNLAETGRRWRPAEIYWVIDNGIKMTAMPAWENQLSQYDIWATAAFVKKLPDISPAAFRAQAQTASIALASAACAPAPGG